MIRARITIDIAFYGDDSDAESAVAALRQAGFEVVRMPDELRSYHSRLNFPEDSFWEASTEALVYSFDIYGDAPPVFEIGCKVTDIVEPFGGKCVGWGPVRPDYIPFECWLVDRDDGN
jgi:hypothetical protein